MSSPSCCRRWEVPALIELLVLELLWPLGIDVDRYTPRPNLRKLGHSPASDPPRSETPLLLPVTALRRDRPDPDFGAPPPSKVQAGRPARELGPHLSPSPSPYSPRLCRCKPGCSLV